MRCSVAGRSTVAGTTARAIASLFSISNKGVRLREVGVFNTTANAVAVALVRFNNATGVGAGLTEVAWDNDDGPAVITAFAGHTGDGGVVAGVLRQATLGGVIGSGVIWTFGEGGIETQAGTANGIGIICPTGTGQILDYYYDWEE